MIAVGGRDELPAALRLQAMLAHDAVAYRRPAARASSSKAPASYLATPDQVARDVVAPGETVERLAGNELLRHLPLEVDAMTTVLGHGPSS
jgi:hypothetical protein